MTNKAKRFTKKDRRDPIIRVEQDLFRETWSDFPEPDRDAHHFRTLLANTVEIFTDGIVSVTFCTDGVLVHTVDTDPKIQHRLVFPFKLRTFYVTINWAEAKAHLTQYVTLTEEEATASA